MKQTLLILALPVVLYVTPGDCVAAAEATGNASVLSSHVEELYAVPMMPLWACSLVLAILIFERLLALREANVLDGSLTQTVIDQAGKLDFENAQKHCEQSNTTVGRAWAQGLREFNLGGVDLEETLTQASFLALKPLKRNIQAIGTIATIAPLLGLLGTVVGMVLVFDEIRVSLNPDKQKMAEGIMIALFTTVFGIVIAIPGIIARRAFLSRVQRFSESIESDIDRVRYGYLHARSGGTKNEAAL